MNALHLIEAPTLHSVASICHESPSGASLAQFLMVSQKLSSVALTRVDEQGLEKDEQTSIRDRW